ncbi:MAG: hypothetical protein HY744_34480, partial [Deltaproteobacteria bacterium]|nr:hypothetical protein [Deltaproteobacteria bacterium]
MRLAVIAAPRASQGPEPAPGERDAALVQDRLALPDLGFEVAMLDPGEDLAQQLDTLLGRCGEAIDALLLYASCLVAVVGDEESYLCLDPSQPDIGDSVRDLSGVIADHVGCPALIVVDARYDPAAAKGARLAPGQVIEALRRSVDGLETGVELIAAARPLGAHPERVPSRLTAGLLEAIDGIEGPASALQAYAVALQQTSLGPWPNAASHDPGTDPFWLRSVGREPRPAPVPEEPPWEPAPERRPVEGPEEQAPPAQPAKDRPAPPSPAPAPARARPRRDDEWAASATIDVPASARRPRPPAEPLPKVIIGAAASSPPPVAPAPTPEPAPAVSAPVRPAGEMSVDDCVAAGDERAAAGDLDVALAEYKRALGKLGAHGKLGPQTEPVRAEIYVRIGNISRQQGKLRVALSNYDKALAIDPSDTRALRQLIDINAGLGKWRGVEEAEERFLAETQDDPSQLDHLLAFGQRWLEQAGDPQRARQRWERARDSFPRAREPLERLQPLYEAEGATALALATRKGLASLIEDPVARADACFALGQHCLGVARRPELGFDALELALEANPEMLQALEALATDLAEHQQCPRLEQIYRKMIGRFAPDDAARRLLLVDLHRRLSLLYRDHLGNPTAALAAIDGALRLAPGDLPARLLAADLALGLDDRGRALMELRQATLLEPRRADTLRRIFAVAQRSEEPDVAFLAAGVLCFLGEPEDRERIVFAEHRAEGVPRLQRALRPGAWEWLREERRERTVDTVMRALAPAVLRVRVRQLEREGKLPALRPEDRVDPKTSTLAVAKSFGWGCHFLGIEAPALYVDKELPHAIVAPFAKHLATIVGRDVLSGRTPAELAFLVGRHLALRLPEHELVTQMKSMDELSACFLAAIKIVTGRAPEGGDLGAAVAALADLLARSLSADERAVLEEAVARFGEGGGRTDLNEWVIAVERCASRAGYVLCGDLETAAKVMRSESEPWFSPAEARIDDLCAYA